MEGNAQYLFDKIYVEKLRPALSALKRKKRIAMLVKVFTILFEVYFFTVVLSLFLGFMAAFPFHEFPGKIITIIFQGFMYTVFCLVILIIVFKQTKLRFGELHLSIEKNRLLIMIITLCVSAAIFISAFFIGTAFLGNDLGLAFFIKWVISISSIFILILPYKLMKRSEAQYLEKYSDVFIQASLPAINKRIRYLKDEFFKAEEFSESQLFSYQELYSYKGSHLFQGNAHQFHGSRLEVKQKETTVSDGKTETKITDLFKGFLFSADFNKTFKGRVMILPDNTRTIFGEVYGEYLNTVIHSKGMKLVKMEHVPFEEAYSVYATDENEARYLLSIKLIEKIAELKNIFFQELSFSFVNNKVFIAIATDKDLFAPHLFGALDNKKYLETQFGYLYAMLNIPETLDLDNEIWIPKV